MPGAVPDRAAPRARSRIARLVGGCVPVLLTTGLLAGCGGVEYDRNTFTRKVGVDELVRPEEATERKLAVSVVITPTRESKTFTIRVMEHLHAPIYEVQRYDVYSVEKKTKDPDLAIGLISLAYMPIGWWLDGREAVDNARDELFGSETVTHSAPRRFESEPRRTERFQWIRKPWTGEVRVSVPGRESTIVATNHMGMALIDLTGMASAPASVAIEIEDGPVALAKQYRLNPRTWEFL